MMKWKNPIPFVYRDFYDVPRMLVCIVCGVKVLLDSPFDDATDDYSMDYFVYTLPRDLEVDEMKSWVGLSSTAAQYLGKLPVSSVVFDESKRKELMSEDLVELLNRRVAQV